MICSPLNTGGRMSNKLSEESSPYLLQHAGNPVDWYSWGEEAFKLAAEQDKAIFLSIGYSTCHWCHVMAHESFENPEIADLLNQNFINIKVDREERPDIDKYFMSVAQSLIGSGGWPLTIIMTPDRKPFYAATYIPPEARYGRVGMNQLIPEIGRIWKEEREKIYQSAEEIITFMKDRDQIPELQMPTEEVLSAAFNQLSNTYDTAEGGFGTRPKFPSAHNLLFLLRYFRNFNEPQALVMVEKTLQKMAYSGIFDQVGHGFHRYSTDAHWKLPHFEKMLYDQAMLMLVYTETWQITGKNVYADVVRKTASYLLTKMRSTAGGFFSAEDADSEGEEGKFYVFSLLELQNILNSTELDFIKDNFDVSEAGNFLDEATGAESGKNIFHFLQKPTEQVKPHWEKIREKILIYRENRTRPFMDDKVLTDWNGLTIAALAKAGKVFSNNDLIRAAEQAHSFIEKEMMQSGNLYHSWRAGKSAVIANLDDHAFLIWGLLELYEATLKSKYLLRAMEMTDQVIEQFQVADKGGYYFTRVDAEEFQTRSRDLYDGAYPSGNSVMFYNLNRLYRYTIDKRYFSEMKAFMLGFGLQVKKAPAAYAFFLAGLDFYLNSELDVVLTGDSFAEVKAYKEQFDTMYQPNSILIYLQSDDYVLPEKLPWLKNYQSETGKAKIYVCRDRRCEAPITELDEFNKVLTNNKLKI